MRRCWWCWCRRLLAFVFGFFAFRSRIKGVYFSIITQALTFAFMLLFFRNDTGFGGNNGFTDFKRILGFRIAEPATRAALVRASPALYLIGAIVLSRAIIRSKLGRVLTAIRDSESRLMFSGYNPLWYKLFVWTLSAVLCGIAGALYVPQVGIINPSEMSPANSIEIAIWVAVGGRGTLLGPVLGAGVVNGAKSFFTQAFPEYWLFFLGLLFILVTLFLPKGVVGADRPCGASGAAQAMSAARAVSQVRASAARLRAAVASMPARASTSATAPILYLDDITVSFDGFKALNKLTLTVDAGELRCVIGPNGAGKTTMMDVITGKTRPDAGTAFFGQTIDLTRLTEPRDRARRHRPQVPEAHRVREPHGVREPRAGDEDRQARAGQRCARKLEHRAARPHRADAGP